MQATFPVFKATNKPLALQWVPLSPSLSLLVEMFGLRQLKLNLMIIAYNKIIIMTRHTIVYYFKWEGLFRFYWWFMIHVNYANLVYIIVTTCWNWLSFHYTSRWQLDNNLRHLTKFFFLNLILDTKYFDNFWHGLSSYGNHRFEPGLPELFFLVALCTI